MKFLKFSLFLIIIHFSSCNDNSKSITKPTLFEFGCSMTEIKKSIVPLCDSIHEKLNIPIQLPTAQNNQSQLDCMGFLYAGKKEPLNSYLLMTHWILTEPEEEDVFIQKFEKLYGKPTHKKEDITFFIDNGVAVRNKPHEVLFISERLKDPYKKWLNRSN